MCLVCCALAGGGSAAAAVERVAAAGVSRRVQHLLKNNDRLGALSVSSYSVSGPATNDVEVVMC